jgi:hypothetical protein
MAGNEPDWIAPYNIVWTMPSSKALDSMPLDGGTVALNVWTTDHELLFYIGSSDCRVDAAGSAQQVKVGRGRLTLSPKPFASELRQELELASNTVSVSGKAADGTALQLRIWVDVIKPVIHVEGETHPSRWTPRPSSKSNGAKAGRRTRPPCGGSGMRAHPKRVCSRSPPARARRSRYPCRLRSRI